jgi:predicted nucleic acid-binding protein
VIVLDASVLIAHLNAGDAHAARAFDMLDTEEDLLVHPLSLSEALVRPTEQSRAFEALAVIENIGIERWTPDHDEPLRLARLRVDSKLKLPDCCALSAALATNATLASFDTRLVAAARAAGLTALSV